MATQQNQERSNSKNQKQFAQRGSQPQSESQGLQTRSQSRDVQNEQAFPFEAVGSAVTTELVNNFAPPIIEDIMQSLSDRFGSEKVEKWTNLLGINNQQGNTEGALFNIARAAIPGLPKEFDFKNLTDWEPIKRRIEKNPVATAATVAVGVGLLFAVREYLSQTSASSQSSRKSKVLNAGKSALKKGARVMKKAKARTH